MNKIDAFGVIASLLLVWIFAIFLLPYEVVMFFNLMISSWWVGTSIARIPRILAKETDKDHLMEMIAVAEEQAQIMGQMLQWLKISSAGNRSLLARIDELMFEYCPENMTPEQIANYEAHVRVASQQH